LTDFIVYFNIFNVVLLKSIEKEIAMFQNNKGFYLVGATFGLYLLILVAILCVSGFFIKSLFADNYVVFTLIMFGVWFSIYRLVITFVNVILAADFVRRSFAFSKFFQALEEVLFYGLDLEEFCEIKNDIGLTSFLTKEDKGSYWKSFSKRLIKKIIIPMLIWWFLFAVLYIYLIKLIQPSAIL
jgi:small-conductance mechanosensitive channel